MEVKIQDIINRLELRIKGCEDEIDEIKKGGIWNIPEAEVPLAIANLEGQKSQAQNLLGYINFILEA